MATEFIDGETLRQHLRSGIKLTEILEIAITIWPVKASEIL
ncbi:MAG: hypothetical protein ACR2H4_17225 [Pyrinomonadaceae bacterium]